ncbi:MAG: hypothetical protein EBR02_06335 [Alphaproteobacteria bacterium]|nr:hypothetical protein [Alphaproteobacteria bacterium]
MWIFIIFGVLMIGVGQYRRIHAYDGERARMMRGDPLINAINKYNEKETSEKGGISGLMSRGSDAVSLRRVPSTLSDGDEVDSVGESVPEDAFAPEQEPTPRPVIRDTRKVRPGPLPVAGVYPMQQETPKPPSGFYPPVVENSTAAQPNVPSYQPTSPDAYYPPVDGR